MKGGTTAGEVILWIVLLIALYLTFVYHTGFSSTVSASSTAVQGIISRLQGPYPPQYASGG